MSAGPELKPNEGVVAYDVNTPLFSDYATKSRTVWMPQGKAAVYRPDGTIDFPVGTIFTKTFSYGNCLIETRLLVRMSNGWTGLPYVWSLDQKDAVLDVTAEPLPIHYRHPSGRVYDFEYTIPNVNQCKTCHEMGAAMRPLGATARNLNRALRYSEGVENQLAHWTRIGYLKGAPAPGVAPKDAVWDDPASGSVESRARAYLDVNCADCHTRGARADESGLFLAASVSRPAEMGVCKAGVNGGYDIMPGDPEHSVMIQRMTSLEPKLMMPSLGHSVVHAEGVALVREWIRDMKGNCAARTN